MEGDDGGDDSEFGSVTSSQASILKHSRFAGISPDRRNLPENSSGDRTESDSSKGSDHSKVLGDRFSSPVVRTPILTSQDSIFRTPPEEPYFSSAADSDPTVRVSLTDPASASAIATGDSEFPSSGAEEIRVLLATPDSASSSATEDVRVSGAEPALATGDLESPLFGAKNVSGLEATPDSSPSSPTVNVRVSGKEAVSAFVGLDGDSASPLSGAENARVSGKRPGSASASAAIKFRVLEAANNSAEDHLPVSLKDVIEAILRNSGEEERSSECENLSIVDILRKSGIQFPD
ncbi:PREDICTED: uncharacterized protein LOC104803894 [Tarenaya hassleriana]|uniref:uncharacterized protein LOC104803894 n=1 Tax=Tarenaya hassleriana TaxID=28532 RepID=UPI00053C546E|nr:PREDICTED: uncharacterized protein LOC104803894 [Tarenaya hassleriana]